MSRIGGILLEQLGDSVIDYIKYEVDNHTHESEDIENILTREEVEQLLIYKSDLDHRHNDLEDLIQTHDHDTIYRKKEESYSKDEVDYKVVEIVNNGTNGMKSRGILFNDSSTIVEMDNCTIEPSSNTEAVGDIIKTTGSSPYNMTFQVNRSVLILGKNMYKIRLNTNANSGKISLKINSVNSFESDTDDRVLGNIYTKTLDISSKNEFIDIYDVFDMKILNTASIGIEILIEHLDKSEDYNLELDHIIITPAMPGMFI